MNNIRHNFDNASLNMISKEIVRTLPGMKEEEASIFGSVVDTIEEGLLKQFDAFPSQNAIDLTVTYNEKKYAMYCSIKDSETRVFRIKLFSIRAIPKIPKTYIENMTDFRTAHGLSINPVRIRDTTPLPIRPINK